MKTIIEVTNLTKTYDTYKRGSGFKETIKSFFKREHVMISAVDDISFSVEEGDIIGLLGPNGAGKSTTIKMLTGALFPSSGTIDVMGYSPSKNRLSYVNQMGAVFGQKSQLIWDIPPLDSFHMNKAIYNIKESDFKERLDQLVELFGIEEVIHKPTRVLSLGERMKCEFVMAMLHKPKVVFLDEPTIGLDVIAKQKIRDFIQEMNKQGTTFILTTHDLEDVEQLAQKVIIINHGKKVFDGSIKDLTTYLGAKKVISLTFNKPVSDIEMDGVKLINQPSPYEIDLELDQDILSIGDFLQIISKKYGFNDISIKSLPMDQIITNIYESKLEQ